MRTKLRWTGALAVMLCLYVSPVWARWEVHRGANVKFELPDSWTVKTDAEVLVTQPPNAVNTGMEFVAIDRGESEAKAAEAALMRMIARRFPDAKITGKAKKVHQHGMVGWELFGKGTKSDQEIKWFSIALHGADLGKGILVVGFAPAKDMKEHKTNMNPILHSIQPAD